MSLAFINAELIQKVEFISQFPLLPAANRGEEKIMLNRRVFLGGTGALGSAALVPGLNGIALAKADPIQQTTFTVDDVKPGTKPLPLQPVKEAMQFLLAKQNQPLESWSTATQYLVKIRQGTRGVHPFLLAMNTAYDRHYPIILSPDMIWLLILGGLANHVNANSEKLRDKFVSHKDKLVIEIRRDNFAKGNPENDWEDAFAEFSQEIRSHIGPKRHDNFVCEFSTTGPVEKAAMEVALMDSLQSYFTYAVTTECGYPAITLEGSAEDWQKLRAKAEDLSELDLDWWMPHLLPVLDQFVAASQGSPDKEFWCDFYKWASLGSGDRRVQGHVNALFPYLGQKRPSREAVLADLERFLSERETPEDRKAAIKKRFIKRLDEGTGSLSKDTLRRNPYIEEDRPSRSAMMRTNDVTTTMNSAPFIWNYHGDLLPMELLSGFVGSTQDPESLAVRPTIGWAVREGNG